MDIAMNEYSFIKTFFHAEDTTIFMDVFKETSKYVCYGFVVVIVLAPSPDDGMGEQHL